jgi:uncharacterized BrkB/YihY/UPF0761 family membrane protein
MKQRLEQLVARVQSHWIVRRVFAVMESANAAGAPLLSMALAYTTMFAILPGLILLVGVLGWLIEDPVARARVLREMVDYLPPLAPVFADSLDTLVRERGTLSVIGLVGLLWGASSFYAALDDVMRRLFPGGGIRSFLSIRVRGVVAVAVLVLLVVGTVALSGVWAVLRSSVGDLSGVFSLALPLLSIAVITLVVLITYLWVPTAPPGVRAALPPAIVAGIGIGLLTNLFGVIAPLLVGGLAGFGVLTAVFGTFVWLNLCFQLLLWAAAWARYRRDRVRLRTLEASGPAGVGAASTETDDGATDERDRAAAREEV